MDILFGIWLLFASVGVIIFGLWLWSLIHCINNQNLSSDNRMIGIILIVVLGGLGSIIYLFLPREPRSMAYRRTSNRQGPRRRSSNLRPKSTPAKKRQMRLGTAEDTE